MIISTFPHNFVSVILNSLEEGRVSWSLPKYFLEHINPFEKTTKELAILFFEDSNLFLNKKSFLTESYIQQLDPKIQYDPTSSFFLCSANTSAYLGLPGDNFKDEMNSIIPFLKLCQKTFEDFYIRFPESFHELFLCVQKFSDSQRHFNIQSLSKNISEDENNFLEEHNKQLELMIKNDMYLSMFSQHYINMLNQIGKNAYSNTQISYFFFQDDPYHTRITNPEKYKKY